MPDVVYYSKGEETEYHKKGDYDADDNNLHRNVSLCSDGFSLSSFLLPAELACSKSEGRFYHSERLHYTHDAGCSNASDADVACIILEYLVRGHLADGLCDAGVHKVDHLTAPDEVHQRNYHKPYEETSAADDEGIFQSHDISQTEYCSTGVDFQKHFGLVCKGCSPREYFGREGFAPEAEGGYDEVVQTSDQTADEQSLRSLSTAFTAHKYLSGGSRFRKRIFPMLLLHKIFSERYQEKNAEDTSKK